MIKINGKQIVYSHFPDGTLLMKQEPSMEETATITWLFENNEELVVLHFLNSHLKAHGVSRITLEMPYIPNARQDVRKAVAPSLRSGRVCPVNGMIPEFTDMCRKACPVIRNANPPMATLANSFLHKLVIVEHLAMRLRYSRMMNIPPMSPASSTMKLNI